MPRKPCPKCGGVCFLEEDEEHELFWHCLQCSYEEPLKPSPLKQAKIGGWHQKSKYIKEDTDAQAPD